MKNIVSNLTQYVVDELLYASDIEGIGPAEPLLTSGVLDSLGSAQLMVYVEETFAIRLEPNDLTLENFNTLEALANLVTRHLGK